MIRLDCDDAIEREQVYESFLKWREEHPEYEQEIKELDEFSKKLLNIQHQEQLSGHTCWYAIQQIKQQQKKIDRIFSNMILGCAMCLMVIRPFTTVYFADEVNQTFIPKEVRLKDGSQLLLGANTAVNIHLTAKERHIELIQGSVYVDVAHQKNIPFIVDSHVARYKALGTSFIVEQYKHASLLYMVNSTVKVTSISNHAPPEYIHQNYKLLSTPITLGVAQKIDVHDVISAWNNQQVLADDLPLTDLLDLLNQQNKGHIFYNQKVLETIKINGVIKREQDISQTLNLLKLMYPQLNIYSIMDKYFYIGVVS